MGLYRDATHRELLSQVDTCDEVHYSDKLVNILMGYVYAKESSPPQLIVDVLGKLHHVTELAIERVRRETRREEQDKKTYYWGTFMDELFGPYDSLEKCQKDAKQYETTECSRVFVKLTTKEQHARVREFDDKIDMQKMERGKDGDNEA